MFHNVTISFINVTKSDHMCYRSILNAEICRLKYNNYNDLDIYVFALEMQL